MFDDGAGGLVAHEFRHQFEGGVGVVDVVVGEFLALPLARGRHAFAAGAIGVEGRRLVRVFAIAQGLGQFAREGTIARGGVADFASQPVRHGGIIGGGAGIGRQRHLLAEGHGGGTVMGGELIEQRLVIGGVRQHGDEFVVLGRGADHGGTADVDILDAGGVVGALGHRFLERVEVHDEEVDRFDPVRGHGQEVFVIVAQRQKRAMDIGVQRLDPAIHHFGEARHIGYITHLEARRAQHAGGAPGGDEFHPPCGKGAGEVEKPGFVGDGNQRAADGNEVGHGRHPPG